MLWAILYDIEINGHIIAQANDQKGRMLFT